MYDYTRIPPALRAHDAWILWRFETKEGQDKPAKMPVGPDGRRIDLTDPANWMDFDTASGLYLDDQMGPEQFAGLGIVLHGSGLVGIDLDDTDDWKDEAREIVKTFKGRGYMEKSPSGKGLRIIVRGRLPENSRNRSKDFFGGKCEVYDRDRFLTITGNKGTGDCGTDWSDIVAEFVHPLNTARRTISTIDDPMLKDRQRMPDADVIIQMNMMAAEGKPGAVVFRRLWEEGFADDDDPSDALASAVYSLSNVTTDIDQVRRVLELSPHIKEYSDRRTGRNKWDRWFESQVPTILRRKVDDIEAEREERRQIARRVEDPDDPADIPYIDRFVWVGPDGMFFDTKTGASFSPENLNRTYKHEHRGGRDDPVLATILLEDDELVRCDGRGWMPCPFGSHRATFEHHRATYVNTWQGFALTPFEGDVAPWMELLEHLVPDPVERGHLLRWFAFNIQSPDVKLNWHPVIIGVYGAGKDSLLAPIARIFGDTYSAIEDEDLKSQYDDGFARRKFIHVNEIRGLRGSALERLKRRTATQGSELVKLNIKSEKQVLHPNLWSFVFLTNHKDAMNITKDERRFFVVYASTPMSPALQKRYFTWLDKGDGANHLFDYLLKVDLTDFDPTRVPMKSKAFLEMVDDSKSMGEIEFDAMVTDGSYGLGAGLVNAKVLMDAIRAKAPFTNLADVKTYLSGIGWKPIDNIYSAVKKIGGKTVRQPTTLWAPIASDLHELEKRELFEAIEKRTHAGDFLDG